MRSVTFSAVLPIREETTDITNKCIRRILDFIVYYNEQEIGVDELDVVVEAMIGQEKPYVFPDNGEEYYLDDVVFTAPHRARLHLSRPMLESLQREKLVHDEENSVA